MPDKFIILGSNSFSGSHFVNYLLEKGCHVIGISRSGEFPDVFLPYADKRAKKFQFLQLDLNHDLDKIVKVVGKFRPDYIINFAAQGMVAESWEHPEQWLMTNMVSPIMFHDRLRKSNFLKKFVQISTPEVYGNCTGDMAESTLYAPSTPYAVSKAAVDMSLTAFQKAYGFPVVFTRSANVYGSGQQLYRIIPRTILCFLIGEKLKLHGGGRSIRSFIHIRDVAVGTLKVAKQAIPGSIYHFSTNRYVSIRELVEIIAKKMEVSFEDNVEIVGDRLGKDSVYQLDSGKARSELNWQVRITLEQGINETIAWVKNNIDMLLQCSREYIHKP